MMASWTRAMFSCVALVHARSLGYTTHVRGCFDGRIRYNSMLSYTSAREARTVDDVLWHI